jgi:hypothetical protein
MKNLLAIISISILLFYSCQTDETKEENNLQSDATSTFDSSALQTTTIDTNEEQSFLFRYKFESGKSYNYRLTTISNSEQSIIADSTMSESINQKIIFLLNFKTLNVDEDSIAELECIFSSINLNTKARSQEIIYESTAQNDSSTKVQFAEYESLVNNPFNLRVNKLGVILDIYKADKIISKFLQLRGLSDSLDVQQKIMASQELTNRSIKPLLTQIFREVPEHKMAKDSSWSYKRESMPVMIFQVDYENVYNVTSLEKLGDEKLAVISGSVKTNVRGKQNYSEKGINYNFSKPKSTATGKIYFNLSKGLIQKSRTESKMEIGYNMEMQSPEGVKKASALETTANVNVLEML